jgi:hypothetical protein
MPFFMLTSSDAYLLTQVVKASGLCWLACMLLALLSWTDRVWALPFLTVLCPSERYYAQRGRRHQPLTARAWQMIQLIVRWLPGREIVWLWQTAVLHCSNCLTRSRHCRAPV